MTTETKMFLVTMLSSGGLMRMESELSQVHLPAFGRAGLAGLISVFDKENWIRFTPALTVRSHCSWTIMMPSEL